MGLVTYGEFISTPYDVGIEAGVDALLHMSRYELGVIPDELQRPLVDDPTGPAANTAYDYSERLPPTDPHLRAYARFLATHHAALMPTFSLSFLQSAGASQSVEGTGRRAARSCPHVRAIESRHGRNGLSARALDAPPARCCATLDGREPAQEGRSVRHAAVAHQ